MLAPETARTLLDSIDVTVPAGLRDRAVTALKIYSFARIGAALRMRVEDAYTQNRHLVPLAAFSPAAARRDAGLRIGVVRMFTQKHNRSS